MDRWESTGQICEPKEYAASRTGVGTASPPIDGSQESRSDLASLPLADKAVSALS